MSETNQMESCAGAYAVPVPEYAGQEAFSEEEGEQNRWGQQRQAAQANGGYRMWPQPEEGLAQARLYQASLAAEAAHVEGSCGGTSSAVGGGNEEGGCSCGEEESVSGSASGPVSGHVPPQPQGVYATRQYAPHPFPASAVPHHLEQREQYGEPQYRQRPGLPHPVQAAAPRQEPQPVMHQGAPAAWRPGAQAAAPQGAYGSFQYGPQPVLQPDMAAARHYARQEPIRQEPVAVSQHGTGQPMQPAPRNEPQTFMAAPQRGPQQTPMDLLQYGLQHASAFQYGPQQAPAAQYGPQQAPVAAARRGTPPPLRQNTADMPQYGPQPFMTQGPQDSSASMGGSGPRMGGCPGHAGHAAPGAVPGGMPGQPGFPGGYSGISAGAAPGFDPLTLMSQFGAQFGGQFGAQTGASDPQHLENRYGQLFELYSDFMQGKTDPSKIMNFLTSTGTYFWKGAIVGTLLTLVMTDNSVKSTLGECFSGIFGGKSPSAE